MTHLKIETNCVPKITEEYAAEYRKNAENIYKNGIERAKKIPKNEYQKFNIGDFVYIKDLSNLAHIAHFPNKTYARVEYTYNQAYGNLLGIESDKERQEKELKRISQEYSLLVRKIDYDGRIYWSSSAWFFQDVLELCTDEEKIENFLREIENE